MQDFNMLIPLIAAAIPVFVAIAVAPTGTNRVRVLISLALSALLPVASMVAEREITEPMVILAELLSAIVAQNVAYHMLKGVEPNLNDSLGDQGIGKIEIDV